MTKVPTSKLNRNLKLYDGYTIFFNTFCWMPVFFLFFSERFTIAQVLQLEAVYYTAVVLIEVPSGYFSDRVGRKITLCLSNAFLTLSYALFFFSESWGIFAIAQILLAAGISFNSGTDTSFLYDSLAGLNRKDEYDQREAKIGQLGLLASAFGALTGGVVAIWGFEYAYALSALTAIISFIITMCFVEPPHEKHDQTQVHFFKQLGACLKLLNNKTLLWLSGFGITMICINHIPYEFYQKYVQLVIQDLDLPSASTPMSNAIHVASTMFIASYLAGRSVDIRNRFGLGRLLLFAGFLQVVIIFSMGNILHPLIILLALLRSAPRALTTAPIRAALAPLVPNQRRATYLSIISLTGRLSFAGVLLLTSTYVNHETQSIWTQISISLNTGGSIALAIMLILLITIRTGLARRTDDPSK